ncbi:MAG: YeeE/YedE family protein [Pseudomonadota bacterium]
MTEFSPFSATLGGILIGISVVLLMLFIGRVAGMTGIVAGIIPPLPEDWKWRASFLAGAVIAPILYVATSGQKVELTVPVSHGALVAGGLLVGIGVTFGSGCTSGHGVCGIARLSTRSIVATGVFMISTFVTVFLVRHVFGS